MSQEFQSDRVLGGYYGQIKNKFLFLFFISDLHAGLRYSSRRDDFTWGNGKPATVAAWRHGEGKGNLAGGLCSVLDVVTSGSWANAQCDSMLAKLVCEMPAAA